MVTGHDAAYIDRQMPFVCALVWEQVYWQERDQQRKERGFGKVANIRCISPFESGGSDVI
jgi:hypothetical protein